MISNNWGSEIQGQRFRNDVRCKWKALHTYYPSFQAPSLRYKNVTEFFWPFPHNFLVSVVARWNKKYNTLQPVRRKCRWKVCSVIIAIGHACWIEWMDTSSAPNTFSRIKTHRSNNVCSFRRRRIAGVRMWPPSRTKKKGEWGWYYKKKLVKNYNKLRL